MLSEKEVYLNDKWFIESIEFIYMIKFNITEFSILTANSYPHPREYYIYERVTIEMPLLN